LSKSKWTKMMRYGLQTHRRQDSGSDVAVATNHGTALLMRIGSDVEAVATNHLGGMVSRDLRCEDEDSSRSIRLHGPQTPSACQLPPCQYFPPLGGRESRPGVMTNSDVRCENAAGLSLAAPAAYRDDQTEWGQHINQYGCQEPLF
jgi:hypothetical protein